MYVSSAFALLLVCSVGTIKAQNDDWDQKVERAKESLAAGRYDEAATAAAEAMDLLNRDSPKDARLPITINLLAVAKHLQGRYVEAKGLFQDAITAWRTQSDPSDRAPMASVLFNLAQTQIELQQYDAAEHSLTEVEAIRGDKPEADSPNSEDVLSFLAFVYQAKGLITEAETYAEKAVSLALGHADAAPQEVAIVYHSRGRILLANGRYNEAALYFREALDWAVKAHGGDHPFVARAIFSLADVYLAQSRTDLAQPLLTRGLRIVDRTLGPGSATSAEGLERLGYLYTLDGKFGLAQKALDQALTIEESAFGRSNPRLVPILNRSAAVRFHTNQDWQVLTFLSRSLEIARGIPWLQSTFATTMSDRAFVEARLGRIVEAEEDYKNAITTMESMFGATDSRLLPTLKVYASFLRKARRPGWKDVNHRIKLLQAKSRSASQADPISARRSSGNLTRSGARGHE